MKLVTLRRGVYTQQDYPAPNRGSVEIPPAEIIVDFFDALKSRVPWICLDGLFIHRISPQQLLVKLEVMVGVRARMCWYVLSI